jgi:hypothetical protein
VLCANDFARSAKPPVPVASICSFVRPLDPISPENYRNHGCLLHPLHF